MDDLLPFRTKLLDGTAVVLSRMMRSERLGAALGVCTLESTLASAHQLLNHEISMGISYPFEQSMSVAAFEDYFLGCDAFCLRVDAEACPASTENCFGQVPHQAAIDSGTAEQVGKLSQSDLVLPDPQFIGCFYVKPNYPGRSSHLCNGGFLVAPSFRGLGAGYILGERYRFIAQRLGYRGSVFNLVFLDNPASLKLWERLQFTRVGLLPGAGRHPLHPGTSGSEEHFVSAYIWYLDLTKILEPLPLLPNKIRGGSGSGSVVNKSKL